MKRTFTLALGVALVLILSTASTASAQGTLFVKNDRVSIGVDPPEAPLHVVGAPGTIGTGNAVVLLRNAGSHAFQLDDTTVAGFWNFANANGESEFRISKSGTGMTEMKLTSAGDLTITGSINTTNCAPCVSDYVFEPDYELMSLYELEDFVKTNKHMPNVPSQGDVDKAGVLDMTTMQMRMLEKIEELALHTIAQQKTIDALQARLEAIEH